MGPEIILPLLVWPKFGKNINNVMAKKDCNIATSWDIRALTKLNCLVSRGLGPSLQEKTMPLIG